MEEDYSGRYERINGFWPQVDQQSSHSDLCWNQNQNESPSSGKLTDLYRAKQRFKQFIEEIAQLKKTPIRQDILKYCQTQGKKQKTIQVHYKPQTILKKIQIRIQKMIKTKRIKRNWGQQDIKILLWIISKYSDWKCYNNIEKQLCQQDWKFISTLIPGVSAQICMFKWLSLKKITLSTNSWSDYESSLLSNIVQERNNKGFKHNSQIHDWKQISQQLYLNNQTENKVYRNAKQCREHWTCYLSPQLKKGPWQLYEDVRLLKFIKANNGLKKWSQISRYFEGRTQNALKNRYTLIIDKQRKLSKNKHKTQIQLVTEYLEKCYIQQFTSQKQQDQVIYEDDSQPKKQEMNCELKHYLPRSSGRRRNFNQNSLEKQINLSINIKDRGINKQLFQVKQEQAQQQLLSLPHPQRSICLLQSNQMLKKQQNFQQIFEQQNSSYIPRSYQEDYHPSSHHIKNNDMGIEQKYPQSLSGDSHHANMSSVSSPSDTRPITPIRVEVLKFKDIEKIGIQNFLKFIQPGVIDSSGKFKKVQKYTPITQQWKHAYVGQSNIRKVSN